MKYKEIVELYQWCKENLIHCNLEPLFDGYQIRFLDNSDIIQHFGSYGNQEGFVEPAGIDPDYDYSAVSLEKMKEILSKKYLTNNP